MTVTRPSCDHHLTWDPTADQAGGRGDSGQQLVPHLPSSPSSECTCPTNASAAPPRPDWPADGAYENIRIRSRSCTSRAAKSKVATFKDLFSPTTFESKRTYAVLILPVFYCEAVLLSLARGGWHFQWILLVATIKLLPNGHNGSQNLLKWACLERSLLWGCQQVVR